MAEFHLTTPIHPEKLEEIKVGDIVYITGTVITARDEAHLKALELHKEGKKPPVDFKGNGLFHCGPVMKKTKMVRGQLSQRGQLLLQEWKFSKISSLKLFILESLLVKGE